MIKAIIFDFDGTIYNSMEAIIQTYVEISGISAERLRRLYNPNWREFERELGIPRISYAKWDKLFRKYSKNALPFSGAKSFLQKIKEKYKTALVTAGNLSRIKENLRQHDLLDYFDVIITADDVENLKPHPESLELALKELNMKRNECVYIGDANVDALSAKNIGMRFIGVNWGFHDKEIIKAVNDDPVVDSFDELYRLISSM